MIVWWLSFVSCQHRIEAAVDKGVISGIMKYVSHLELLMLAFIADDISQMHCLGRPVRSIYMGKIFHQQTLIISPQYFSNMQHSDNQRHGRSALADVKRPEDEEEDSRPQGPGSLDWEGYPKRYDPQKQNQARSNLRLGRIQPSAFVSKAAFKGESRAPRAGPKYTSVVLPKDKYRPGMIVRCVIHEPTMDRTSHSMFTVASVMVTATKLGPVTSKCRKLIVIGTYEDHYMAVPLYTHNGKGLSRKSKPDEYISVRDHRQTEPFSRLSKHPPLVTNYLNPGVLPYDPVTTAHIPYLVSRGYVLPVVHEGYLEPDSTHRLLELVGEYCRVFAPRAQKLEPAPRAQKIESTPRAQKLESAMGNLSLNQNWRKQ